MEVIYNEDTGRHINTKVYDNNKVDLWDGFNDFMLKFNIDIIDDVIEKLEQISRVSDQWDDYDDYDSYEEGETHGDSIRFENLFNHSSEQLHSNYLERPRAYLTIEALEKVRESLGQGRKSLRKLLQEYREKRKRK